MKQYIIIGNGVAAVGCVEGIRSVDSDAAVTVLSAEPHATYCRPLISYYLEGKTDQMRMAYRSPDFETKMGCTVRYGVKATALDTNAKTVALSDGTTLSYDAVCCATGSKPFIPPMENLDKVTNSHSFMTLDDALALEECVTKDSTVLIVGAGLIGLKCAEGLRDRAGSITVCDLANHVLPSILDAPCAQMVQKHLEHSGIHLILADSVAKFDGNHAVFKSGAELDFDVLVVAVGVRPAIELVKEAGGTVNRGIQANDRMATSLPNVYAAGDCVESLDVSSGRQKVMALMPNAYMQGYCAGVNMAGGESVWDCGIPMNSIGFFGLHIATAGTYEGECYEEVTDDSIKRLYTKDGYLCGMMAIGNVERVGIYTDLIRRRVPLSSLDYEQIKKDPSLFAFSASRRKEILGGAAI